MAGITRYIGKIVLNGRARKAVSTAVYDEYTKAAQLLRQEGVLEGLGAEIKLKTKGWFSTKDFVQLAYKDEGETLKHTLPSRDAKTESVYDYLKKAIATAKKIEPDHIRTGMANSKSYDKYYDAIHSERTEELLGYLPEQAKVSIKRNWLTGHKTAYVSVPSPGGNATLTQTLAKGRGKRESIDAFLDRGLVHANNVYTNAVSLQGQFSPYVVAQDVRQVLQPVEQAIQRDMAADLSQIRALPDTAATAEDAFATVQQKLFHPEEEQMGAWLEHGTPLPEGIGHIPEHAASVPAAARLHLTLNTLFNPQNLKPENLAKSRKPFDLAKYQQAAIERISTQYNRHVKAAEQEAETVRQAIRAKAGQATEAGSEALRPAITRQPSISSQSADVAVSRRPLLDEEALLNMNLGEFRELLEADPQLLKTSHPVVFEEWQHPIAQRLLHATQNDAAWRNTTLREMQQAIETPTVHAPSQVNGSVMGSTVTRHSGRTSPATHVAENGAQDAAKGANGSQNQQPVTGIMFRDEIPGQGIHDSTQAADLARSNHSVPAPTVQSSKGILKKSSSSSLPATKAGQQSVPVQPATKTVNTHGNGEDIPPPQPPVNASERRSPFSEEGQQGSVTGSQSSDDESYFSSHSQASTETRHSIGSKYTTNEQNIANARALSGTPQPPKKGPERPSRPTTRLDGQPVTSGNGHGVLSADSAQPNATRERFDSVSSLEEKAQTPPTTVANPQAQAGVPVSNGSSQVDADSLTHFTLGRPVVKSDRRRLPPSTRPFEGKTHDELLGQQSTALPKAGNGAAGEQPVLLQGPKSNAAEQPKAPSTPNQAKPTASVVQEEQVGSGADLKFSDKSLPEGVIFPKPQGFVSASASGGTLPNPPSVVMEQGSRSASNTVGAQVNSQQKTQVTPASSTSTESLKSSPSASPQVNAAQQTQNKPHTVFGKTKAEFKSVISKVTNTLFGKKNNKTNTAS